MIRAFLANLDGATVELPVAPSTACGFASNGTDDVPSPVDTTSIFHHHRLDYETILDLVPRSASVLDLGCGTGGLLARLARTGATGTSSVSNGTSRPSWRASAAGSNVIQADLNKGLPAMATASSIRHPPQTCRPCWMCRRCCTTCSGWAARDRQFPQHRLSKIAGRTGRTRPSAAGTRRTRLPVAQHALRPFPLIRRLRGVLPPNRFYYFTSGLPWIPKQTAESMTIPNLNADVADDGAEHVVEQA